MRLPRLLAALPLAAGACGGATDPIPPRVAARVAADTVVAVARGPARAILEFTLPVTLRNDGPELVTYYYCASGIERQTGAGAAWSAAWRPICAAAGTPAAGPTVPPGGTLDVAVPVLAGLGGGVAPAWEGGSVAGAYRFRAALVPGGWDGPVPTAVSNVFVLVVAP